MKAKPSAVPVRAAYTILLSRHAALALRGQFVARRSVIESNRDLHASKLLIQFGFGYSLAE
jgi:hypothetical protein